MLSIAAPFGGNFWYGLTSISPFAGVYYLQKGNRQEEVRGPLGPAWQDPSVPARKALFVKIVTCPAIA